MADKNFIVKNGLTVGGAEVVNSSGALTQSLITAVPSGATATTQSTGNSSTALATTAYVRGEIDALINSAPGTLNTCLLYTSPSPRDGLLSRMPSSA